MLANSLPDFVIRDLADSGLAPEDLNVRILDNAERAATVTPFSVQGYVLPYFDIRGKLIPFYRCRLFEGDTKYRQPKDSPNHVYFPKAFQTVLGEKKYVIITEGEKKAAAACKLGFPCVGLGGVDSWHSRTILISGDAALSQHQSKLSVRLPAGGEVVEDYDSPIAIGLVDLIDMCVRKSFHVIVCYDTDEPHGCKSEVQRAAAILGYELRFRGISFDRIRQLILPSSSDPNRNSDKVGLDDYLVAHGPLALTELLRATLIKRGMFPKHPNVRDYVNKRLQAAKLARKETQNISLAILSDLDSHGVRLRSPTNDSYYFDHTSRKLLKAEWASHRDEQYDAPFNQFLYREYGLSAADHRLLVWLGTQFSSEEPVELATPHRVFAWPQDQRDCIYYQLSDSEFAEVTGDGVAIHNNGDLNVLFEADQVDPLDTSRLLEEFAKQSRVIADCQWAKTLSQVRLRDKDKQRIVAALLYYMSPWLLRWRGLQLPVELIIGESGSGKAQPLDAKVLTPTGWRLMDDLQTGDLVTTPDGSPSKVVAIYPQGLKDIYRIEFHDQSSTECCADHLWVTTNSMRSNPNSHKVGHALAPRLWSTQKIKEGGLRYKKQSMFKHQIPMIERLDLTLEGSSPLPLQPYLLGALLGDGSFRLTQPGFTSADQFIIDKVVKYLPVGSHLNLAHKTERFADYRIGGGAAGNSGLLGDVNPVRKALKDLDLWEHTSLEKFIPEQYFWTTYQNRLELLQGLMDTDGSAITAGAAVFNSSSKELTYGVQRLVQTLGGTATINLRTAPEKARYALAYNAHIRMPIGLCPFSLPYKVDYFNSVRHQKPSRAIKDIVHVGQKEAKCIAIEDPKGLYVTDQFIVTHNSTLCELRLDILTGRPLLRNTPTDLKDWHASVTNTGGLHVTDNVQLVDKALRQRLSDEICRIITEPEPFIEQRKYYTNAEQIRIPVRTVFALTAIQQPFFNADLIARAFILELDKTVDTNEQGQIRYDSNWKQSQLDRFGGREAWVAHHFAVLQKFFRLAATRWKPEYSAKHRLINFEQAITLMADVFAIPNTWIADFLVNASDRAVAETDWILEGLHAFAFEHNKPHLKSRRFRTQVITEWILEQHDYKDNEILTNARKLGKYLQAHKSAVFHLTGIREAGMEGNRIAYRFEGNTLTRRL